MQVVYLIFDRRFYKPNLKVILTEGDKIYYDSNVTNVLACSFCFFEESEAEKYAIDTWGKDYNDVVLISPLQNKAALDEAINFHTKIKPELIWGIKKVLAKVGGLEADEIKNTDSFTNDLGLDSLDQVEALMELEKEFNVTITDEEAENWRTVGDIIKFFGDK